MTNNLINNIIIFLIILVSVIIFEYFFLNHSFIKKEEKKEIIQQIKLIEIANSTELLLIEAQKKLEAEAEQRKKLEAEAEQRKKLEAEAKRKSFIDGLRVGYIDSLREEIERNKKYPLLSKSKNEEGVVLLSFRINKNGKIDKLKIIKSSGYEKLDEAAIKAVEKGVYKNIPNELEDEYLDIQVPIKFNLN